MSDTYAALCSTRVVLSVRLENYAVKTVLMSLVSHIRVNGRRNRYQGTRVGVEGLCEDSSRSRLPSLAF